MKGIDRNGLTLFEIESAVPAGDNIVIVLTPDSVSDAVKYSWPTIGDIYKCGDGKYTVLGKDQDQRTLKCSVSIPAEQMCERVMSQPSEYLGQTNEPIPGLAEKVWPKKTGGL